MSMSALLHSAGPVPEVPMQTPVRGNGFFSHHGVWAPGVRLFRRLAFTAKAVIISLALMLPMLGLLGWTLQSQSEQALQARRDALRQHVQIAHGLLVWAHGQEAQGRLPRAQARQLALQALQPLHYDGGEPFWVQDLQPQVLMPAGQGAPEGRTAQDSQRGNSLALYRDAAATVRASGKGFIGTPVVQDGLASAQPKLSYVMGFEPWGWVIGSSMPIADLRHSRGHDLAWIGGVVALAVLASGYLFLSFYRVMDGGLRETRRHLRAMSEGDLTTSPRPWGKDESAQLMQELSRMQASLRGMVHSVRRSSDGIVQASDAVAGGAAELSARTENAATALEQSTVSMAQIAAKVNSGVAHTEEAAQVARHNAEIAEDGGRVMREMVDTMQGISSASARIGEIIGTIDGIAFQTNILALNAAVEAARAGAQGRGFAVVANEVRMLAQRSAEAAKEIKALIGGSVQQVQAGTVVVRKAGTAMHDIVAASQRVNELLGQVAAGAREQSQDIGEVGQAVLKLDRVTQQNASLVERTACSATDMRELARTLAEEVARYRMPADVA
jgi:methyl-accepting chemotaxis protein